MLPLVLLTHPKNRLQDYFGETALDGLRKVADVLLNESDVDLQGDALIAAAQGCEVIIAYRQTAVPASVLSALPDLKAVVRCAVDIRTIDVVAASQQGILVTQASAGFMASVSEWIVGVMIDLSRHISTARAQYQASGTAQPKMGRELRGAVLGVIGYGQIARYLCPIAQALGMRLLVTDPQADFDHTTVIQTSLPNLLSEADYVVCLAPANEATENLMNAKSFALMKHGAFFINASRGSLVDDRALLHALDSGHLGGAALDVGRAPDQMPVPELARHSQVIATPHIGGLTFPAISHQSLETVTQATQILNGKLPAGSVNGSQATRLKRTFQV